MEITISTLISGLLAILISVIGYLLEKRIKELEQDNKEMKASMQEIKGNYIARFEEVNESIHKCSESILACKYEIMEKMHALEILIKSK